MRGITFMITEETYTKLNPYELCPCDSGKKFKFCCYQKARKGRHEKPNKSETFSESRIKNMMLQSWKETDFKLCFAEDNNCAGTIKSAHSIQNNGILNKISEEGHLYTIEADADYSGVIPNFKKISKNKASTFYGFCDFHDTEIFKPIELQPYMGTEEQQFLFAYRGLCIAYHKVNRKMNTMVNLFKKVPVELLNEASVYMYRNAQLDIKDDKLEFEKLTRDLKENNYSDIKTFEYTLDYEINFVVSSYFAVEKDMNQKVINDIYDFDPTKVMPGLFVNIFPINGKSKIIFSYDQKLSNEYDELFAQLNNSQEERLLEYISYVIFNYTEDIYYRMSTIDGLDDKTKQSMLRSYESSIYPLEELSLRIEDLYFDFNLFKL